MCTGVEIAMIAGSALSAGAGYMQSQQQAKAQKKAGEQAAKTAQAQLDAATAEANKQENKQPNVQGMFDENARSAREASGTMLTGPAGVEQDKLALGKNVLLGGM